MLQIGYRGPLCDECDINYVKTLSGTCKSRDEILFNCDSFGTSKVLNKKCVCKVNLI